jgi:hypothetical protein
MKLKIRDFEPRLDLDLIVDDIEDVLERAEDALQHPADSGWFDSELWETHTLMFATPDYSLTDEYLEGWSNYRTILRDLKKAYPEDVEDASFGHWTYSRFCAIKVRVIDAEGYVTPAFIEALAIEDQLKDYVFYDEGDFWELESEVVEAYLDDFANEHKLDRSALAEIMSDRDVWYHRIDGWDTDEADVIRWAREASNTWETHYYSGKYHTPEHCYYCARAGEAVALIEDGVIAS